MIPNNFVQTGPNAGWFRNINGINFADQGQYDAFRNWQFGAGAGIPREQQAAAWSQFQQGQQPVAQPAPQPQPQPVAQPKSQPVSSGSPVAPVWERTFGQPASPTSPQVVSGQQNLEVAVDPRPQQMLMQQTGPPMGTQAAGYAQPIPQPVASGGGGGRRTSKQPTQPRPVSQRMQPTPTKGRPLPGRTNPALSQGGAPGQPAGKPRQRPAAQPMTPTMGPGNTTQQTQAMPSTPQPQASAPYYPQYQPPTPPQNYGHIGGLYGGSVQTSVQPQNVYSDLQSRAAQNVAAANAVSTMPDLRQQRAMSGFAGSSGAIQGGIGAMAGQSMANAGANAAGVGNQMGWQNANNYLQGQQMRDQEGQSWARLANQDRANQWQNQNQQLGQTFGLLSNMYGRM